MSTSIIPLSIRLFCDMANPSSAADLNRAGVAPAFYQGDDLSVAIGLALSGTLIQPTIASSGAGGVASVTCAMYQSESDTTAAILSETVASGSMNLTLSTANWNAGGDANAHAQFTFTNAQTAAITIPNGATSAQFWLRIWLTTTDGTAKKLTFLSAPITIRANPV